MIDGLTFAWQPLGGVYFAAALVVLAAGIAIVTHSRVTRASRRFFVVAVVAAGWLTTLGLAVLAADPGTELLWLRATWVLDPFTAITVLWLVREVSVVRRGRMLTGVLVLAITFAVLSAATPWLVEGLRSATRGLTLADRGWLGALYMVYVVGVLGWAVVELVINRRRAVTRTDRVERSAMAMAVAVGSLTLLDYWLPWPVYRAGWITPPAIAVAAVVAVWVAVQYRVFALARAFGTGEVLAAMSDVVLMLDDDGRIRGVNRAANALLGVGAESLKGQPASRFLREEDGAPWLPEPGITLRDRELWAVAWDGTRVPVSVAAEPLVEGERRRGTVLVARDISDRLAAEEAVALQRRYFEDLFDNIPEAIVMVDAGDRVLRMNDEFTRLFGYTEEEAVGRDLEDLIVPGDRHREGRELARIIAAGQDIMEETVRVRKDGMRVDVSILARRLDVPGEPLQLYAIYRDISERKAAEAKLREREEELRQAQKLESIGTLAGGVAHDFNNLMTVINGHVRFAMEELGEPERVRRDLEEIERAGMRAASLTQQLLAFSSRQVMRPRPLKVNEVVRDTRRMLDGILGEGIRLETRLCPQDCTVRADRGQLTQVLMNLAINARDAMPDGGVLTITTEGVPFEADDALESTWEMEPGSAVRITVADTGVGMDRETLDQIFDPFFTTKEQGRGTGLGLSTVFGIVKQSGGQISVESAPGEGSRFMVYLPRAEAGEGAGESGESGETGDDRVGADDEARPASGRTPASDAAPGAGRTILVAEDEDGVRGLAARVIEREGHTVLTAANGREALEVFEAYPGTVHLVLTDLVMPEMGGRALAAELARRHPELPVLFMSGYEDELVDEAGEPVDLLSKPFTPAQLAERIAERLGAPS